MTVAMALAVGDKFWLEDEPYAYTALKVTADPTDCDCFFVVTDFGEPPMWICGDDIVEILRG